MAPHRSDLQAGTITDERRRAPRLAQADVPWLRTIRPNISGSARLLNISRSGVLFDTRDRLAPGRRTMLVAAADEERIEKLPATVVRTHVVSIAESTGVLYRTALEFDREFPWDLGVPEPADENEEQLVMASVADVAPAHVNPRPSAGTPVSDELTLAGPVDALFSTESSSQLVSVFGLTESGCVVRTGEPVKTGGWVSIAILFSDLQRPLLTGRVTSVRHDGHCLVRFVNLAASERSVLRMELRRALLRNGQALDRQSSLTVGRQPLTGDALGLQRAGQMVTVHAAQW